MLILGTAQFGLNYGINNSAGKVNLNEVYNIFEFALEIMAYKLLILPLFMGMLMK
jgi:hypothetical protein